MAVRQIYSELRSTEIEKFLNSGWLCSLADGRVVIGWGGGEWVSSGEGAECALFAPDFYLTVPKPWRVTECWSVLPTRAALAECVRRHVSPRTEEPEKLSWAEPDLGAFRNIFNRLQASFQEGEAQKAVPVVFARAQGDARSFGLERLLLRALEQPAVLRPYGVWAEGEGLLGLTPESLFRIEDKRLETMALAGTRRGVLDSRESEEFLRDPKERHEHQLVVDDIVENIKVWGDVTVGTTGLLRLPILSHLHTPISARLRQGVSFESVVRALHPTPALGVAPRKLGLEWMRTWDQAGVRQRYGAPFGVSASLPDGAVLSECLVAIRNVQWKDDPRDSHREWRLGSGCGVVPQSVLDSEWKELAAKRESVRRVLDL